MTLQLSNLFYFNKTVTCVWLSSRKLFLKYVFFPIRANGDLNEIIESKSRAKERKGNV